MYSNNKNIMVYCMFGFVDDIDSVTNVQFLLSDNGISRISSISFNSRQVFCLQNIALNLS